MDVQQIPESDLRSEAATKRFGKQFAGQTIEEAFETARAMPGKATKLVLANRKRTRAKVQFAVMVGGMIALVILAL